MSLRGSKLGLSCLFSVVFTYSHVPASCLVFSLRNCNFALTLLDIGKPIFRSFMEVIKSLGFSFSFPNAVPWRSLGSNKGIHLVYLSAFFLEEERYFNGIWTFKKYLFKTSMCSESGFRVINDILLKNLCLCGPEVWPRRPLRLSVIPQMCSLIAFL